MATDKYGRETQYIDCGFGWATFHVLELDGTRAFTLDWKGDAPGEEAAINIANEMMPSWYQPI